MIINAADTLRPGLLLAPDRPRPVQYTGYWGMMRAGDLCSHLSANIVEELIPLSGEVKSLIFYPETAMEIGSWENWMN